MTLSVSKQRYSSSVCVIFLALKYVNRLTSVLGFMDVVFIADL